MLVGPNWQKLYDEGKCLHYGVPFTDVQIQTLNKEGNALKRMDMIRKWRKEYQEGSGSSLEKLQAEKEAEALREKILELDPEATFNANAKVETLRKRLEKLQAEKEAEKNADSEDGETA